jgi:hypothetical protein
VAGLAVAAEVDDGGDRHLGAKAGGLCIGHAEWFAGTE